MMKKLLTTLLLSSTLATPAVASVVDYDTTPVFDNHGDTMYCYRFAFRDYDNGAWNVDHAYIKFNASFHTENKLYYYEDTGDLFTVARSNEFRGRFRGKERWSFLGNLKERWLCDDIATRYKYPNRKAGIQHNNPPVGFYRDKTTLSFTTIPGTSCKAILSHPERLSKPRIFAVESTNACRSYRYAGYFSGQQKRWLGANIHGFKHLLNE